MNKSIFETLLGLVVLIITGVFLANVIKVSNTNASLKNYYIIDAKFSSIDGINVGSDVKIAGIVIGAVQSVTLDKSTFMSKASLKINKEIKLPIDTSITVASTGLFGSKYMQITPGSEDELIEDGGTIEYTQSSVNLESLISKFATGGSDRSDKKNKNNS